MNKDQMLLTVHMNKSVLRDHIKTVADEVLNLFDEKNDRYGSEDALMNFREMVPALKMQIPDLTEINGMYLANEYLAEKHRVTMMHHGVYDPKFEESCKDRIVYLMLAMAKYREWVKQSKEPSMDLFDQ